jgi:hypothetical protein
VPCSDKTECIASLVIMTIWCFNFPAKIQKNGEGINLLHPSGYNLDKRLFSGMTTTRLPVENGIRREQKGVFQNVGNISIKQRFFW